MRYKQIFPVLIVLLLNIFISQAQVNFFSPFSRYGLGEINRNNNGQSSALGDISIGFRAGNTINFNNPAAYTSQDTMSFILDVGIKGNYSTFQSVGKKDDRLAFYFSHFAISFPFSKWMKNSIGIVPYSSAGYNLFSWQYAADSLLVNYIYKGNGGINKLFMGTSVELFKQLSVGVNFNYCFGNLNHTIQVEFPNRRDYMNTYSSSYYYLRGTSFNAGLQYYNQITKNFRFTFGAVYDHPMVLKIKENRLGKNYYGSVLSAIADTFLVSDNDSVSATLPYKIGFGASFEIMEKLTLGVDYNMQDWSQFTFNSNNQSFHKASSLHVGIQFIPNKKSFRRYSDHIEYRIGYYQANSNLKIDNNLIVDRGITFGVGMPMRSAKTKFNLSARVGQKFVPDKEILNENYISILLNISFYDFWFFKRKYD